MEIKEKLKAFWIAMQAWVGESPIKSAVLAGVFLALGYLLNAIT